MNFSLDLPYGMRVFENGRLELFNRKYEVIRVSNPFLKVREEVQFYEVWFYDDSMDPKKSQSTEVFIKELLTRWDFCTKSNVKRWAP